MTEFELIKHYFTKHKQLPSSVICGIGDDAAILRMPPQSDLVITTDTLIAGVHFPIETKPEDIGYKSLAVNLSDLAAMGAQPAWITLALSLPLVDEAWLEAFCRGFNALLDAHQLVLIGGDTTAGPLSITIQAMGLIPPDQALCRNRAKPGDLIYVTGTLGDAGLALQLLKQQQHVEIDHQSFLLQRLNRPTPQVATGIALRELAHAAIDISDGLAADLNHLLAASTVGAIINVDAIPLSAALRANLSKQAAINMALTAGDDYELCFTLPPSQREQLDLTTLPCQLSCIGTVIAGEGLQMVDQYGMSYYGPKQGYQHF